MFSSQPQYTPSNCPNCDAKESAVLGSSDWGHSFLCCSEECGKELSDKIEKNTSSKKYKKAVNELERAKNKVRKLKYKGISVECAPFEYIDGRI